MFITIDARMAKRPGDSEVTSVTSAIWRSGTTRK